MEPHRHVSVFLLSFRTDRGRKEGKEQIFFFFHKTYEFLWFLYVLLKIKSCKDFYSQEMIKIVDPGNSIEVENKNLNISRVMYLCKSDKNDSF